MDILDPIAVSTDDDVLKLLYLVVRPEEKHAVEAAIENVVPPIYSTMRAQGRGREGGLSYGRADRRWWRRRRSSAEGVLIPKVVFYLALPAALVDEVLSAVAGTLRAEGGPAGRGLGIGFVVPVTGEIAI